MKQLFIIRHAKSDQRFFGNDFERPLNERGNQDAPVMARRIKERYPRIDAFVSSPAQRANETAAIFAGVFQRKKEEIILVSALYQASAETLFEVVASIPDTANTVALFSHNPGITDFVNRLVEGVRLDNMPTCGIFAVEAMTDHWSDFAKTKKEFLFFDYPKRAL